MNKKFKLEKVLELREKALEREKIKLADLQLKEKQAYEEMNTVMEDIKTKNSEMEQDRAKGLFDFIEMYNKYIAVRQNDLLVCETKVQAASKEVAKQKEVLKKITKRCKSDGKIKSKTSARLCRICKKNRK